MNKYIHDLPFAAVQICWITAATALLIAGFDVVNVPDNDLLSVANHLGMAMMYAGFTNLMVYIFNKHEIHGSRWLLADGMTTALLSIFPLFNKMIIPVIIPIFFGIWELFLGVIKFIESTELKEEKIKGWHWFRLIGVIEILSGVAALIKPVEEYVGMNHVIAIILFIQCTGYIFKMIYYNNLIIRK